MRASGGQRTASSEPSCVANAEKTAGASERSEQRRARRRERNERPAWPGNAETDGWGHERADASERSASAASGQQRPAWPGNAEKTVGEMSEPMRASGAPAQRAASNGLRGRGTLRIGNASGFYGDRFSAVGEMLADGELDVLTGDYLAELTMLILGKDRIKDPATGYAKTFLRQMEESPRAGRRARRQDRHQRRWAQPGRAGRPPAPARRGAGCRRQRRPRRGRRPAAPSRRARPRARPDAQRLPRGVGDRRLPRCRRRRRGHRPGHRRLARRRTGGRSLRLGRASDFDALAGATVAGHVIECSAQATGGNFSFFTEIGDLRRAGFPIAEIAADGSSVITKHPGTGGAVTTDTVTAQLLYEIAGPRYAGPDVTTRFDTIVLDSRRTGSGTDHRRARRAAAANPEGRHARRSAASATRSCSC